MSSVDNRKKAQTQPQTTPVDTDPSHSLGEGEGSCVKVGEVMRDALVGVQLSMNVEEGVVNMNLDRRGTK